jgi:hypothetical protein
MGNNETKEDGDPSNPFDVVEFVVVLLEPTGAVEAAVVEVVVVVVVVVAATREALW